MGSLPFSPYVHEEVWETLQNCNGPSVPEKEENYPPLVVSKKAGTESPSQNPPPLSIPLPGKLYSKIAGRGGLPPSLRQTLLLPYQEKMAVGRKQRGGDEKSLFALAPKEGGGSLLGKTEEGERTGK